MTLFEIRKLFCETSGRWDLRNDDGSDNGANFYINSGIKNFLDLYSTFTKTRGVVRTKISSGNSLSLPFVRSVDSVFVKLKGEDWKELPRVVVPEAPFEKQTGKPAFYFVDHSRSNVFSTKSLGTLMSGGYENVVSTSSMVSCSQVVFLPFPEQEALPFDIIVTGLFRHPELENDEDENFWTVNHPNLVVYAACRELEIAYRNTQGVRDWENALLTNLSMLEQDEVLDEANHVTKILY